MNPSIKALRATSGPSSTVDLSSLGRKGRGRGGTRGSSSPQRVLTQVLTSGSLILVAVLTLFMPGLANAQDPPPQDKPVGTPIMSVWEYDPATGLIQPADTDHRTGNKRNLPFDVPFLLRIKDSAQIDTLRLGLRELKPRDLGLKKNDCATCEFNCLSTFKRSTLATGDAILMVPPLRPNTLYQVCLTTGKEPDAKDRDRIKGMIKEAIREMTRRNLTSAANDGDAASPVAAMNLKDIGERIKAWFARRTTATSVQCAACDKLELDAVLKGRLEQLYEDAIALRKTLGDLQGIDRDLLKKVLAETPVDDFLNGGIKVGNNVKALGPPDLVLLDDMTDLNIRVEYLKANIELLEAKKNPEDTDFNKALDAAIKLMQDIVRVTAAYMAAHEQMEKELDDFAERMAIRILDDVYLPVSTSSDFMTRATWYLAPDVGFAFIQQGDNAPARYTAFYGLQFHVVPINREAPYSLFRPNRNWREHIGKALSGSIGISTLDVSSVSPDRKGIVGDKHALMLGVGLRVNNFLRLNTGNLYSLSRVDTPLSSRFEMQGNWYYGASIDIDLVGYVQRIMERAATKKATAPTTTTN